MTLMTAPHVEAPPNEEAKSLPHRNHLKMNYCTCIYKYSHAFIHNASVHNASTPNPHAFIHNISVPESTICQSMSTNDEETFILSRPPPVEYDLYESIISGNIGNVNTNEDNVLKYNTIITLNRVVIEDGNANYEYGEPEIRDNLNGFGGGLITNDILAQQQYTTISDSKFHSSPILIPLMSRFFTYVLLIISLLYVANYINIICINIPNASLFLYTKFQIKKTFIRYGNDAKRMIKEQMLQFMTQKTLDIMFKCFDVFKEKYPHKIKSKSAADIAAIIYRYPIQNVIRRIQDENITGEQFEDIRDIIEQETGWKKSEIYQIESILLKHHTFTKSQFEQNMNIIAQKDINDFKAIPAGAYASRNIENQPLGVRSVSHNTASHTPNSATHYNNNTNTHTHSHTSHTVTHQANILDDNEKYLRIGHSLTPSLDTLNKINNNNPNNPNNNNQNKLLNNNDNISKTAPVDPIKISADQCDVEKIMRQLYLNY